MTLLELCDELGLSLVIKRLTHKNIIKYSVYLERVHLYHVPKHREWDEFTAPRAVHTNINKALKDLCDKVSYTYISNKNGKEVYTDMVNIGNLSILGV